MITVVLVDDEDRIRNGIAASVDWSSLNCRLVGTASDGCEALELHRILKPDCIITDIRMPRINGLELIRRVREVDGACELVILTGHEEFEIAREAMRYGVNHYLLKPFDETDLADVLMKIQTARFREPKTNIVEETPHPDVNRMITAIRNNHRRSELSLAWIIDNIVFKNRDYLGKIFQQYTGISFNRYLNEYRISLVMELLEENPHARVYELAERVGYASDGRYLSTQFRRITGRTLSDYRKSISAKNDQDI